MTVEAAIYSRLSGYSALTSLLAKDSTGAPAIYPNIREQDAPRPSIEYRLVSDRSYSAMGSDSGIVVARFQIDIWADNFTSTKAIEQQVKAAMRRYKTTGVFDVFIVNTQDLYEGDSKQHHIAIDIEIHYSETTLG
jgi:hypothetical protein